MPILSCPVPSTISTLNPNSFQFSIQKYPELNYFLQEVSLPTVTLGTAIQTSSVHDVKLPGETMEFGTLNIEFLIDEKLSNYLALFGWIQGLGYPEGHQQYTQYMNENRNSNGFSDNSKMVSDCFLMIMDSNNKPLQRFTFVDAFPTSLGALTFRSNNTDVQYLVASLTMEYSYFKLS